MNYHKFDHIALSVLHLSLNPSTRKLDSEGEEKSYKTCAETHEKRHQDDFIENFRHFRLQISSTFTIGPIQLTVTYKNIII